MQVRCRPELGEKSPPLFPGERCGMAPGWRWPFVEVLPVDPREPRISLGPGGTGVAGSATGTCMTGVGRRDRFRAAKESLCRPVPKENCESQLTNSPGNPPPTTKSPRGPPGVGEPLPVSHPGWPKARRRPRVLYFPVARGWWVPPFPLGRLEGRGRVFPRQGWPPLPVLCGRADRGFPSGLVLEPEIEGEDQYAYEDQRQHRSPRVRKDPREEGRSHGHDGHCRVGVLPVRTFSPPRRGPVPVSPRAT